MKEARFPSSGLTLGFRIGVYTTIDEGDKAAGTPGAMLDFANAALMAWGAGAQARKAYVKQLEDLTGVVRKFGLVKLKNDATKTRKSYSTPDGGESENKFTDRVTALLQKGDTSIKPEAFKTLALTVGAANSEEAVAAALQKFADNLLVTPAADGKPEVRGVFNVDAKEVERTQKAEALAQRYKDAAANIIKNDSQTKWIATFTKENITFSSFVTVAPSGADEATVTAVADTNAYNLAMAIRERELAKIRAEQEKRSKEYV